MACAGIPLCEIDFPSDLLNTDKTTRLTNMAFEMQKFVERISPSKSLHLQLKIGIHEGDVIAGIIGTQKPQFSLIGDTVNTSSRVCSHGEIGKVTLSESAMRGLKGRVVCTKRIINAKGKGSMVVFDVRRCGGLRVNRLQRAVGMVMEKLRENKRTKIRSFKTMNDAADLKNNEIIKNIAKKSENFDKMRNSNDFEKNFQLENNTTLENLVKNDIVEDYSKNESKKVLKCDILKKKVKFDKPENSIQSQQKIIMSPSKFSKNYKNFREKNHPIAENLVEETSVDVLKVDCKSDVEEFIEKKPQKIKFQKNKSPAMQTITSLLRLFTRHQSQGKIRILPNPQVISYKMM